MMNKLFLVFVGMVGLAMGQSVSSIPAATGGGGGGGGITSCGVGQTLNGAACDNNPAVMAFNSALQTTDARICRSTTGNDTYTCSLNPAATGLGNGTTGSLCVVLTADTASTGASTLNVNTLGAKALQNADGTDATITANKPASFCYDGTQFVLQGGGGTSAGTALNGITYVPFGNMASAQNSSQIAVANTVQFQQFPVWSPGMVANKYKFYTTGAAQGNIAVALYDSTCTLISGTTVQFSAASSNASQSASLSAPVTLTPGIYFIAWTSTVTTARLYGTAGDFGGDPFYSNETTSRTYFAGDVATGTGPLTMPGACGTRNAPTGGGSLAYFSIR